MVHEYALQTIYIYIYIAKAHAQAESLLHSQERATAVIGFHVNADKWECMYLNRRGNISTLKCGSLKLVNKFTYLESSVSSSEKDIHTRLAKAWTAIDSLSMTWKSDLSDKIKHNFFQAAFVSILLYRCTSWTHQNRQRDSLNGANANENECYLLYHICKGMNSILIFASGLRL